MNEDPRREQGPATLDEKLVAYLLGEADEAVSAEVESALAADAALRARRDELQSALGLLRTPEIAPALASERREALRAAAAEHSTGASTPTGRVRRFPMLRAAAGLLLFGGIVALAMEFSGPLEDAAVGASRSDAALESRALDSLGYSDNRDLSSDEEADAHYGRVGRGSDDGEVPASEPTNEVLEELVPVDKSGTYKGPSDSVPPPALQSNGREGELQQLGLSDPAAPAESLQTKAGARVQDQRPSTVLGVAGRSVGDVMLALPDASAGLPAPGSAATPSTPNMPTTPSTPNTPTTGGMAFRRAAPEGARGYVDLPEAEQPSGGAGRAGESTERLRAEATRDRGGTDGYAYDFDVEFEEAHGGQPRCIVVDGYGRRYVDEDVLAHLRPHHGQRRHESPRDMFFRYYGDNPWVATADEHMSTFAADVDTASYPLARNYLVQGHLPPKDSVRTEEFVNYFPLGLLPPAEGDFAVHLDAVPTVFALEPKLLLRAGIKAREVSREERKPLNLVFVVDTSGSMASGNRIELVKRALELLVDQVRDDDTIGIVRFSSDASEVLAPTQGAERWEIREAVRRLSTGGSTNAGAGLELGYAMAERAFREGAVNRVVLASDGVANTGETDQERILANVRAKAEAHIDLTTIGVGMGNHNDVFLEQLADKGDGSCHYVDDFEEAKRVLVDGFTGTMQTVARDVKIQLEFDGEVVQGWRQLGYENRSLTTEQFRDDSVDAGEVGAGHEVAALYELDLAPGAAGDTKLVTVRLRWFPDGADEAVEEEHTLSLAEARSKWALAPAELRLSAVAAQFAEVLRRSYHAREDSYAVLREASEALAAELRDARVTELRDLIQRTESLARRGDRDDPLVLLIEEARRTRLLEAKLAMQQKDERVEEMLEEVRRQNERIEAQLQELLEKP